MKTMVFFTMMVIFLASCMIDTVKLSDTPPHLSSSSTDLPSKGNFCEGGEFKVCAIKDGVKQAYSTVCEALELGFKYKDLVSCHSNPSSSSEVCTDDFEPVCAWNEDSNAELSVRNICLAKQSGFKILNTGNCVSEKSSSSKEPGECDSNYEPVCALDLNNKQSSFSNACYAENFGAQVLYPGLCKEEGIGCSYLGQHYDINEQFRTSAEICKCTSDGVRCIPVSVIEKPKEEYYQEKYYVALGAECQLIDFDCTNGNSFSDDVGCGCFEERVCSKNITCSYSQADVGFDLCFGSQRNACPSSAKEVVQSDLSTQIIQNQTPVITQELIEENWDLIEENWDLIEENWGLIQYFIQDN